MTTITRKKRRALERARSRANETREMTPLEFRADIRPDTLDAKNRTVEVVWSTGARVRREPWFGEPFDEELSMREGEVVLDRLNKAAPVLRDHWQSTQNVVGVVERAWLEGERGIARVRFASTDDVATLFQKIAERVITQVSIGYRVFKYEDVTKDPKGVRVLRAVRWAPYEISFVAVGADADASVRSATRSSNSCTIVRHLHEVNMTVRSKGTKNTKRGAETTKPKAKPTPAPTRSSPEVDDDDEDLADVDDDADDELEEERGDETADEDADDELDEERADEDDDAAEVDDPPAKRKSKSKRSGAAIERERAATITRSARASNVPIEFAERLIRKGTPTKRALIAITNEWARMNAGNEIDPRRGQTEVSDERQTLRRSMEEALMHRFDPTKYPLKDDSPGRQFVGMSLREIARESLERVGVKTRGLAMSTIVDMALGNRSFPGYSGTTDFALTLENIATKTLRQAYEEAPQTWRVIARTGTLPDFKIASRVNFGGAPNLLKVNESGEIEQGAISDASEKYQLVTYARIFAVNRQAIINDDLSAFTRVPALFGVSARNLESDVVWAIVTANGNMADGVALFASGHGNLVTPALSLVGLTAARAKLRLQTGLNGQLINVSPKTLIVPAALETTAQQFTLAITPQQPSSVNPFVGLLQPVAEPRLDGNSATAWYLAGSPGQIDIIEASWLEGNQGPRIETRMGFEVEGVQIKAVLDFGAKAIDWRGIVKSDAST